jgi:predicted nucleic acid-binding protein
VSETAWGRGRIARAAFRRRIADDFGRGETHRAVPVLDTNVYIGWLNRGQFAELVIGRGLARYLSAVVEMELRAGAETRAARRALDGLVRAYRAGDRILPPSSAVFSTTAVVFQKLRHAGRDVRRASLVHDVLIALTARAVGATVYTQDADFTVIRGVRPFALQIVTP